MRVVEKRAATVREAVGLGLAELGVPENEVAVEVLAEGRPGLFGVFGREEAHVRLTWQPPPPPPPPPDKTAAAAAFVAEVARLVGVEATVATGGDDEAIRLDLAGEELAVLIGRHGQTLDALQYVTNLVAGRDHPDRRRIIVDVEGYRQRREENLTRLARRAAERARRSGKKQVLDPMPANERRLVHLALQDEPGVETRSEGEEPHRRIVIFARR